MELNANILITGASGMIGSAVLRLLKKKGYNRFLYPAHDTLDLRNQNVGTMAEISIANLAALMAELMEFEGKIVQDTSKPDGAPRKCLDSSKLSAMGWKPAISLREGLKEMYHGLKITNSVYSSPRPSLAHSFHTSSSFASSSFASSSFGCKWYQI